MVWDRFVGTAGGVIVVVVVVAGGIETLYRTGKSIYGNQ